MNDPGHNKLWSIPGNGVLARQGSLVLLTSIDDHEFAESLLDLLVRVSQAGGDGRALGDGISAQIEAHRSWGGAQDNPSIVAFGPVGDGGGMAFTVSGTASVEFSTSHAADQQLTSGHPSMVTRSTVGVPVRSVRATLDIDESSSRTDRFSRLDSGTVRAGGLSFYAGPLGASSAQSASPVQSTSPVQPLSPVAALSPVAQPVPPAPPVPAAQPPAPPAQPAAPSVQPLPSATPGAPFVEPVPPAQPETAGADSRFEEPVQASPVTAPAVSPVQAPADPQPTAPPPAQPHAPPPVAATSVTPTPMVPKAPLVVRGTVESQSQAGPVPVTPTPTESAAAESVPAESVPAESDSSDEDWLFSDEPAPAPAQSPAPAPAPAPAAHQPADPDTMPSAAGAIPPVGPVPPAEAPVAHAPIPQAPVPPPSVPPSGPPSPVPPPSVPPSGPPSPVPSPPAPVPPESTPRVPTKPTAFDPANYGASGSPYGGEPGVVVTGPSAAPAAAPAEVPRDGVPSTAIDLPVPPAQAPFSVTAQVPAGTGAAAPEDSASSPVVLGVYCKNGHFTDPEARSCLACGTAIKKRAATPQPGPRPPLGVLVLDDGSTVAVDGDYVLGRNPSRDQNVADGTARPLRVVDAESMVSRIHARIHLDGWQVLLTDLGSANGTHVQPQGAKMPQRLDPQVPVPIHPGTLFYVGSACLRFEPTASQATS